MKIDYIVVKSQSRKKLAERIKQEINANNIADRIVQIIYDEGGKWAKDSLLASLRAYIYFTVDQ